jgi:predicted peptidase
MRTATIQRPTALCFVLLAAILSASALSAADSQPQARQQETKLKSEVNIEMGYLLYLPPDYEKKDSWPLMLFLHGAGERGSNLSLVKKHGPPKLIDAGRDFPMVVVSPQCADDQWWEPVSLTALLDEVVGKYHIDKDRVYVTGLSMGGFGTWALAAHTPDRFAAIAPICGGGEPFMARRINKIPMWVFHGAKDGVVPLERSERMVEAVKKAGGNPQFTVYPEAGHDSWTETYDNPKFYEWMLAQKRGAKE